jgi:hypothetical protein
MKMALERLEPCAMKVARTVLRRVVTGDSHGLSDTIGLQTPYMRQLIKNRKSSMNQKIDYARVSAFRFAK